MNFSLTQQNNGWIWKIWNERRIWGAEKVARSNMKKHIRLSAWVNDIELLSAKSLNLNMLPLNPFSLLLRALRKKKTVTQFNGIEFFCIAARLQFRSKSVNRRKNKSRQTQYTDYMMKCFFFQAKKKSNKRNWGA